MPLLKIVLAVWLGRSIKYSVIAYIASHAPTLLAKLFPRSKSIQKEILNKS